MSLNFTILFSPQKIGLPCWYRSFLNDFLSFNKHSHKFYLHFSRSTRRIKGYTESKNTALQKPTNIYYYIYMDTIHGNAQFFCVCSPLHCCIQMLYLKTWMNTEWMGCAWVFIWKWIKRPPVVRKKKKKMKVLTFLPWLDCYAN